MIASPNSVILIFKITFVFKTARCLFVRQKFLPEFSAYQKVILPYGVFDKTRNSFFLWVISEN